MSMNNIENAIVNNSNFSKTSEKGSGIGCYVTCLLNNIQNSHTHTHTHKVKILKLTQYRI